MGVVAALSVWFLLMVWLAHMAAGQRFSPQRVAFVCTFLYAMHYATALEIEEKRCAPLPRVVIGCWQLLERDSSRDAAVQTLEAYAAAGFTAFDTADIYGPSESILGAFREAHDGPLTFHTKYVTQDSSKANAVAVNKQSRKSLRVESLDLVQFHWWDFSDGAYVETAKHLVDLRTKGLIGEVAACNFDATHLETLLDAGIPLVANQVQYSLLDRRPENGVIALATKRGLQLTCFGTAAGGWLSDKYLGAPEPTRSDISKGTVSLRMYKSSLDAWGPWSLFQELLKTLRAVGDELDASISAVAVAWVLDALDRTCGGSVILGVRDASHLDDHVRARDLALDDMHRAAIRAVLDKGAAPRGDIWSRERG